MDRPSPSGVVNASSYRYGEELCNTPFTTIDECMAVRTNLISIYGYNIVHGVFLTEVEVTLEIRTSDHDPDRLLTVGLSIC